MEVYQLKMKTMPRIKIGNLPTKIHRLDRLTEMFDGPQLYIKRDDKKRIAFGVNKVRQLEFLMANAVNNGAELIITSGNLQSNHIRQTVSTAARFGLKPVVVITEAESKIPEDCYLFKESYRTEMYLINVTNEDSVQKIANICDEKVQEIKKYYENKGMKACIIPRKIEGTPTGVCDLLEISKQIKQKKLNINYIVKAVDSANAYSAFLLANKLFKTGLRSIGISVSNEAEKDRWQVFKQFDEAKKHLGLDIEIKEEEIQIFNSIGYNCVLPNEPGVHAIKLLADKEAIFLDHYHTGKAMAGLFNLIKKGYFQKDDGVLFLHPGELPALFAQENNLL